MAALEEVIHAEAKDALKQQESQVDDLRRRATGLLAAAAAIGAFLATSAARNGVSFTGGDPGLWHALATTVGVLGGICAFGCAVYVQISRDDLRFSIDALLLIAHLWPDRNDSEIYYLRLADALRGRHRINHPVVQRMHGAITFGLAAVVCEVAGLLVATAIA
jgi:hypothetical protein